ncbi:GvpL/GvpF family gas vesicle protein [Microbispora sp. H10949]|uniref:GvpL/GvpF family gas vesicle protein n=1 Tax=Microbispora sp. H10949 TaxID=2729111 RepID=UPI002873087C|nr:GvpL/GvpF family gas vesicle protein [Microbispora sp. H10949]
MTDHAPAGVTRPPPPSPADAPRAGSGFRPGQGVYLYAVTPGEAPYAGEPHGGLPGGTRGDLRGVGGGAVRPVARGGLVACVSDVPLDQFGEEPLRRHLEDLDWVEDVARAHHAVVETLAAAGPTAPVRLVTVYTGDDQVRDLLDRRHDDFAEILARVAGRREWGVKAYLRRETARPAATPPEEPSAPSPARAPAEPEGGGPGAAYLRRRKESLRGREDLWRAAAERAEELHAALGRLAVASRRHRPQDPRLSGRSESMLLNGAYLVDPAREEEFAAVVAAHSDRFLDAEITGPWAPYSFTMIDLGPDQDGGVR